MTKTHGASGFDTSPRYLGSALVVVKWSRRAAALCRVSSLKWFGRKCKGKKDWLALEQRLRDDGCQKVTSDEAVQCGGVVTWIAHQLINYPNIYRRWYVLHRHHFSKHTPHQPTPSASSTPDDDCSIGCFTYCNSLCNRSPSLRLWNGGVHRDARAALF